MQSFLFHLPSWTILIHSTDEKFFTVLLAFLPHLFGVGKGTWKLKCWLRCGESNYSFRPVINLELINLHYHRAESKFSLLKGEDLGWRVVRWAEAAFLLFVLLLFVLCWVRVVKETHWKRHNFVPYCSMCWVRFTYTPQEGFFPHSPGDTCIYN